MKKAKISDFLKYLKYQVEKHSIYALGAQGETVCNILPNLTSMETMNRVDEILTRISKNLKEYGDKGFDMMTSQAFDCSGLGVYWFLLMQVLLYDTTADGLWKKCTPISFDDIKEGDMVFQEGTKTVTETSKNGESIKKTVKYMHHVGYYAGNGKVIEAKGRSFGVVCTSLDESWTHYGRPDWWEDEKILSRKLKYVKDNMMRGNDVTMVQQSLTDAGYPCGSIDGVYGKKTKAAAKAFQSANNIKATGNVGEKTCEALGIYWNG